MWWSLVPSMSQIVICHHVYSFIVLCCVHELVFFIHSSVDKHFGCFWFCPVIIVFQQIPRYRHPFCIVIPFSLYVHPVMIFLEHMVIIWGTSNYFSNCCCHVHCPQIYARVRCSPYPHQLVLLFVFLILDFLKNINEEISHHGFDLHFHHA